MPSRPLGCLLTQVLEEEVTNWKFRQMTFEQGGIQNNMESTVRLLGWLSTMAWHAEIASTKAALHVYFY